MLKHLLIFVRNVEYNMTVISNNRSAQVFCERDNLTVLLVEHLTYILPWGQKFHLSAHKYELNLERTSNSSQSTRPVGRVLWGE